MGKTRSLRLEISSEIDAAQRRHLGSVAIGRLGPSDLHRLKLAMCLAKHRLPKFRGVGVCVAFIFIRIGVERRIERANLPEMPTDLPSRDPARLL